MIYKATCVLYFLILLFFTPSVTAAVELIPLENAQTDSTFRTAILANGFRYYLKKTKSKDIFMQLVVKAGSVQEKPNQIDLAHALEHMPYYGTKNFKDVRGIFTKEGLLPGSYNASTASFYTNYYSTLPSTNLKLFKTLIKFYKDCAGGIAFNNKTVEGARESLLREKTRDDGKAISNFLNTKLSVTGDKSISAHRRKEIALDNVKNFKLADIKGYYDTWYRPDLQALIIVGDFDIDSIEKEVKSVYSTLPKGTNAPPQLSVKASPEKLENDFISEIGTVNVPTIEIYLRKRNNVVKQESDLSSIVSIKLFNLMANERFRLLKEANTLKFLKRPLLYEDDFDYLNYKQDVLKSSSSFKNGEGLMALEEMLTEIQRIKKFGFTKIELSIAKKNLVKDELFNESISNEEYATKYLANFIEDALFLEPEVQNQRLISILNKVELDSINHFIEGMIDMQSNVTVFFKQPKVATDTLSTKTVLDLVSNASQLMPQPFIINYDKDHIEDLITTEETERLARGMRDAMLITKIDKATGIRRVTLQNGLKIYFKNIKDDRKKDIVYFGSYIPKQDSLGSKLVNNSLDAVRQGGFSNRNRNQLDQFFKFNNIEYLSPAIVEDGYGFLGEFNKNSFEKVLQAVYRYSSDRNFLIKNENTQISKKTTSSSARELINNFILKADGITTDEVCSNEIDKKDIETIFHKIFSITDGNALVIVGDFNFDTYLTLIVKYLHNLPKVSGKTDSTGVTKSSIDFNPIKIEVSGGNTSQSDVTLRGITKGIFSTKERLTAKVLEGYLKLKLTTRLREKEGGTYGVDVKLLIDDLNSSYFINFLCPKEVHRKLIASTFDEITKIKKSVNAELIAGIMTSLQESLNEESKSAEHWRDEITKSVIRSRSYQYLANETSVFSEISAADVLTLANRIFDIENTSQYIIQPKKQIAEKTTSK